jgi:hypothetical protein
LFLDVPMDVDDTTQKDVTASEDAHCVFNVNSYQMVFVANSESVLYKRHAFTRAKQVCNRKNVFQLTKTATYTFLVIYSATKR